MVKKQDELPMSGTPTTVDDIHNVLREISGYDQVYIPEFTYKNLRIDGIKVDLTHRWIRGFEIKLSRKDFLQDQKWTEYSEFCSSLSIVCPEGLIDPEEISNPFGLLWVPKEGKWVKNKNSKYGCSTWHRVFWKKKPKNFQKRNSLSWLYIYTRVLEMELKRVDFNMAEMQEQINKLKADNGK